MSSNLAYNLRETWLGVITDIKKEGLRKDIFTKNHRLLYIGFTIVLFTLLIYAYDVFIADAGPVNQQQFAIVPMNELRRF
jgi:hypothetical protein